MTLNLTRRNAVRLLSGGLLASPRLARGADADPVTALSAIEQRIGGRIGVAGLDAASGRLVAARGEERFPLCSTFKLLAAGLILSRVDRGEEQLDRQVTFGRGDLVTYSPVTELHAGQGMTVAAICRAAITRSDNTAGNLMLASFGGPAALTRFARSLGDPVTRLDRIETGLNEALPDDPRDTTSPTAMLGLMRSLLVADVLSASSRAQLLAWLDANETGAARIRAAAPAGWTIGDKTGTGDRGAASDVAILRPPGRAPILLAIYLHGSAKPTAELSAAIASATRDSLAILGAV